MCTLRLALVMLILAIGCGDAAEVEEPAPETRDVELMSVILWGPHYWNQIETLTFSLNGHDFAREDIHSVYVTCSQQCIVITNVAAYNDGNLVMTDKRYYSDGGEGVKLPLADLAGDSTTVELTMTPHSTPITVAVIAKILK